MASPSGISPFVIHSRGSMHVSHTLKRLWKGDHLPCYDQPLDTTVASATYALAAVHGEQIQGGGLIITLLAPALIGLLLSCRPRICKSLSITQVELVFDTVNLYVSMGAVTSVHR